MMRKKKAKVIRVSIRKIKRTSAGTLSAKARLMILAITSLTKVFKGTQPLTKAQIWALAKDFDDAKAFYKLNGLLGKSDYLQAKEDLINGMLEFAPYVDAIANGDKKILAMSTLPTTEILINIAKLIREGATASDITLTLGQKRQLIADCTPFGEGVHYIAILSEDFPLADGFSINSSGQIVYPEGVTNRVFIDVTYARKKFFSDLKPVKCYYVYYILVFGDVVSHISKGAKASSSV